VERGYRIPGKAGIALVKHIEVQTVESYQTLLCAEPEVSVTGLNNGGYRTLRQTVL
jgi:hypothetical protein